MNALRDIAIKLFKDGRADMIIGYEAGTLPLRASPCIVKADAGEGSAGASPSQQLDRLVWNATCGNNLATYLLPVARANPGKKIGIVAKGCDSRSIVGLIRERQIRREQIVVIGVSCSGVLDRRKIEAIAGAEILEAKLNLELLNLELLNLELLNLNGVLETRTYNVVDMLHSSCLTCQHKTPILYDVLIENREQGTFEDPKTANPYEQVEAIESKSADERWKYFISEMSKCIRCYACRGACPFCYCNQCFIDYNQPQWFGKTTELSDIIIFHLVRAFHVAGRCVNCGACARACPMGVDLMSLTKKMEKDISELYGYIAGMDVEELAPLETFKRDDPQEFITEPE